jgi:hypothetical protein
MYMFRCIYKPVLFMRKPLKSIQTVCNTWLYDTYTDYNILQTRFKIWQFLVTGQSDVSNMKHASYIISG